MYGVDGGDDDDVRTHFETYLRRVCAIHHMMQIVIQIQGVAQLKFMFFCG